ncbi:hypothetical protein AGOR_G00164570 [Albula goreensis]|uniref:Uncharacterized protein n=1 Tax=Albula goreensis TaxID=1534307 RepID=A0A8T3D4P2_9TELE|nr:hypothetical protein AGOR_G00164570 [Albula goreensis]
MIGCRRGACYSGRGVMADRRGQPSVPTARLLGRTVTVNPFVNPTGCAFPLEMALGAPWDLSGGKGGGGGRVEHRVSESSGSSTYARGPKQLETASHDRLKD